VPPSAPFFGDHFPRRPVFPATLLLDAQIGLALSLAAEWPHWPAGTRPAASRMTHVKMRSFIPPGATLDIAAEMAPPDGAAATLKLAARMDGKTAATARLEVRAKENAT
jgi:3-hydroxymyristoyl/3-hydroxydecanoyl-(acyl carrier protein) dehydratase